MHTPSRLSRHLAAHIDVTKGLVSHRQQLRKHLVISARDSKADSIPETAHQTPSSLESRICLVACYAGQGQAGDQAAPAPCLPSCPHPGHHAQPSTCSGVPRPHPEELCPFRLEMMWSVPSSCSISSWVSAGLCSLSSWKFSAVLWTVPRPSSPWLCEQGRCTCGVAWRLYGKM